jgi:hypothetical protein
MKILPDVRLAPLFLVPLGLAAEPAPARRPLTTDRPDVTESPFTVDAGHVQLEGDAVNYTRDRSADGRVREWEVAPFNVRYGLTPSFEGGFFFVPYRHTSETPAGGPTTRTSGAGDLTLRAKYNFAGNDGGNFAWGLIADLKAPTARRELGNRHWEGALMVPFTRELGPGWSLSGMTSAGVVYAEDRRHRPVWGNTLSLGRDLTPNLGGYVELTSAAGDGRHVATLDFGLTRALGPDIQLDCGVNRGLSDAAPDLTVFAGISRKF